MSDRYVTELQETELQNRLWNHTPSAEGIELILQMRQNALRWSKDIINKVPPSREQSLALTKIEEALFWANAGIARHRDYQDE